MKLITFAIPSYNSENYLRHAVDTILSGGEDVEIIIVNDGSKDGTAAIADEYAAKYPTIVRAIHKENGGHGSGVNCGLKNATGIYYKVVDSDDWVDETALAKLIATVKEHVAQGIEADLYITNFIYDHVQDQTQCLRHWRKKFPINTFSTWSEAKPFRYAQIMMMHALMYKTEVLRASGTVLPEHTFYVDNIFAYRPLPYTKKLYYLDVDLYHYFIGRDDQSVNIKNFRNRYDQQVLVQRLMTDAYTYDEICAQEKGLRKYMLHYYGAIMMNTELFCCVGGNEQERKDALKGLWDHVKQRDPKLYRYMRTRGLPALCYWLPWRLRAVIMLAGYKLLCKTVKLG